MKTLNIKKTVNGRTVHINYAKSTIKVTIDDNVFFEEAVSEDRLLYKLSSLSYWVATTPGIFGDMDIAEQVELLGWK